MSSAWDNYVRSEIGRPMPSIPVSIEAVGAGDGFRRLVHIAGYHIKPEDANRLRQVIMATELGLWRKSWQNPDALAFCGEGILFRDDEMKQRLFIEMRRSRDCWAEHWRIEEIPPQVNGMERMAADV